MNKVKGKFQKELKVNGAVRLEVTTGSGDIEVRRGEDGKIEVFGEFEVWAVSRGEAEELARRLEEDPPIVVEGDLVRIGGLSKYGLGRGCPCPSVSLDLSVSAPPQTGAQVSSGSGDQDLRGLHGPVTAKAGSGDVQIQEIEADVDVHVGSGDISVASVRSSVSADSGHGDVALKEIRGPASVRVGSGDVSVGEAGANLNVSTGHGDISVESPIPDHANWVLKAGSGDVSLHLPRESQFKINAVTVWGEIETDFGLEPARGLRMKLEGRVGENATSEISIKMAHGDIAIKAG